MKKRLFISVLLLITMLLTATTVFAAYETTTVFAAGDNWSLYNETRSGTKAYVSMRCESVYPADGGIDLFTKIKAAVFSHNGGAIISSSTQVLSEGAAAYTEFTIKDAYIGVTDIKLGFMGNRPAYDAEAVVTYNTW